MVKATPAPKAKYPKLLFLPYIYAAVLAVLAVVQLMGVGGFDFAHIKYQTAGLPGMIVFIAGLEIFALPFLLRLDLSVLARFFSATFAICAPLFLLGNLVYLVAESGQVVDWLTIGASSALAILGAISFIVLDGARVLTSKKK